MAFKRKAYKGVYEDTNEEFICDIRSDIADLPTSSPQGSTAFVIEDGSAWMITSSGTWEEIEIGGGGGGDVPSATIATNYSDEKTYVYGEYVWQDGTLYRCISPINTAEPWTDAHWEEAVIGDDISTLAEALIDKADVIVDTASGAVASFPDGMAAPVVGLTVGVEPVQDLHGYDAPWPAGGGKNLLANTKNTTTVKAVVFTVNANKTITVDGSPSSGNSNFYLFGSDDTYEDIGLEPGSYILNGGTSTAKLYVAPNGKSSIANTGTDSAFTVEAGDTFRVFVRVANGTTANNETVSPMIRKSTEADATYSPYSNVCPITGFMGAKVYHSGADTSDPDEIDILFPSEAGTVYRGMMDVTTGILVVDGELISLDGTETGWGVNGSGDTRYFSKKYSMRSVFDKKEICSHFKRNGSMTGTTNISFNATANGYVNIRPDLAYIDTLSGASDVEKFKTWLAAQATAGTPVQIVRALETTTTYQLTPAQITTLLGDNNLWADTGDTACQYRASTKLYIDKKLAALVAQIVNS